MLLMDKTKHQLSGGTQEMILQIDMIHVYHLPFPDDKSITITFNSTNIIRFSQWFPGNRSDFQNENKTFLNTYMFNGGKTLTITN